MTKKRKNRNLADSERQDVANSNGNQSRSFARMRDDQNKGISISAKASRNQRRSENLDSEIENWSRALEQLDELLNEKSDAFDIAREEKLIHIRPHAGDRHRSRDTGFSRAHWSPRERRPRHAQSCRSPRKAQRATVKIKMKRPGRESRAPERASPPHARKMTQNRRKGWRAQSRSTSSLTKQIGLKNEIARLQARNGHLQARMKERTRALGRKQVARQIGLKNNVTCVEAQNQRMQEKILQQASRALWLEEQLRARMHDLRYLQGRTAPQDKKQASQKAQEPAELLQHDFDPGRVRWAKRVPRYLEQRVNRLLVAVFNGHLIKYPVCKQIVTLGRSPKNDISVRYRCVSRTHARIVTDKNGTIIEDMNSKNGIMVNARRVKQRGSLSHGDLVEIGGVQFKYIDLMDAEAPAGTA